MEKINLTAQKINPSDTLSSISLGGAGKWAARYKTAGGLGFSIIRAFWEAMWD